MSKYGIVVIGYNRLASIQRLMKSLLQANYTTYVDLIISIDNSGTTNIVNYARTIKWPYGQKIIRTFPKRLGLKEHVLTCGNYINEYHLEAIVVLEDDLFVAPGYFNFVIQAVEKYKNNTDIAGISLYSHSWNINADRPFIPLFNGYDIFFMQYPQSWGQVWTKQQWNDFYMWYKSQKYKYMDNDSVPDNVLQWPESSWLKYHVEYCIMEKKYFIYPYYSLSTNFADAGTHYFYNTNKMQVPLNICNFQEYRLPDKLSESSVYDAYYENVGLEECLGLEKDTLNVDMYGLKKNHKSCYRYLLSTKLLAFQCLQSYGLQMRPWEMNIINNIPGNEIFLYDTWKIDDCRSAKHLSLIHWLYDTRGEVMIKRNFFDILLNEFLSKIKEEKVKIKLKFLRIK